MDLSDGSDAEDGGNVSEELNEDDLLGPSDDEDVDVSLYSIINPKLWGYALYSLTLICFFKRSQMLGVGDSLCLRRLHHSSRNPIHGTNQSSKLDYILHHV